MITINHHHHWAELSAPRPTYHFIWPSHYYQSPLLLGRAVSTEANTMGRVIYTDIIPVLIPLGPSVSIRLQQYNRPTRQKYLQYPMGPSSDGPSHMEHCQPRLSVTDRLKH